jgi:WD40 repeat protein
LTRPPEEPKHPLAGPPPFLVPFPQNPGFVGRSGALDQLHSILQTRQPGGICPAGLSGMGGIGKTQLAVEYAYRYKEQYPGGIFWVNAALPLDQGFAQIGGALRPNERDQSFSQQLRAGFEELNRRPDALLVLDNLADAAQLSRPVGSEGIPLNLACHILFTTRQRELGPFRRFEVAVLDEEPALQLLLRHGSRHAVRDDLNHFERQEAKSICRVLGRLPLALDVAGAFLAEWPEVSLADYGKRLRNKGCLSTLDREAGDLARVNLQPIHDAAVSATLATQWDALKPGDDDARLLFRVAGQFAEAAAIPTMTLAQFAGVSHASEPGDPSPFLRALKRLHDVRLVEELLEDRVRLHPLVREFAESLIPKNAVAEFRHACASRVMQALENVAAWESTVRSEGMDGFEQCLTSARDFASPADGGIRQTLSRWLRVAQREAHHLRGWDHQRQPNALAQQIYFRAVTLGELSLAQKAENRLIELAKPALLLRWRTLNESSALVRLLTGHRGSVNSVAVNPDGRTIVSGSNDYTVAVWDLESGNLLRRLKGHEDEVNSVAVSPDGRYIVSGSKDRTVRVWDLESGKLRRRLTGGYGMEVNAVAVSPDGRYIVSGSEDHTVRVWNFQSGKLRRRRSGHGDKVNSVAVSPDGRYIVSGSDDHTVGVWDFKSGELLYQLTGHKSRVYSVAVSPDGRRVVSGSWDNTVAVWDLESGTLVRRLEPEKETTLDVRMIMCVVTSPDGRYVVFGSADHTVGIWDFESGTLRRLTGHASFVRSVAVSPDGRHIVSGSYDQSVAVWNLDESGTLANWPAGHPDWVRSVAVSPDGRYVLSGSDDRTVAVWDFESGTLIRRLAGQYGDVTSVAMSPDSRLVAAGASDDSMAIWDFESGALLRNSIYRAAVVTPDGRRILAGLSNQTTDVWHLDEPGTPVVSRFTGDLDLFLQKVAMSPDCRLIVTSSSIDGVVAVWDLESGSLVRRLAEHQGWLSSLAVSPDGRRLVSGSHDHTVAIWDLESGTCLRLLRGHQGAVSAVAVSPDGRRVASGSYDETVVVWDLDSGRRLASLSLDGVICSVAWHRDGQSLVTGDSSGNLHLLEYRQACVELQCTP